VITHPDKLLFPADGITKGELAAYYEAAAPVLLPHLAGRPLTLERYPAGIEAKGFIQKDVSRGFPEWLQRLEVPKKDGVLHQVLVSDARSLAWVVNQNTITPHVPTSRAPSLDVPDLCVFDLDPSRDEPAALRAAALGVRDLLLELGLSSWVKTSGSKGFHIVVPLDGHASFEHSWRFSHGAGALLVKRRPELFTQEFLKVERGDRILIDTGRNGFGATFASAYAVRARPGAPVSAPCSWAEIESGQIAPRSVLLRSLRERLDRGGDVWAGLYEQGQALEPALARLEGLLTPEDWSASHAAVVRRPKPRKRATKRP
jgi:bifunctional non-homologous end joining protein LigD